VVTVGTHSWEGVSSAGVTAAYVQEGTEATDATPTLTQPFITPYQGRAVVQFSIEAGQDWGSLQGQISTLIADARSVLDAQMFLTGTGTNQPFGLFGGNATNCLGTAQAVMTAGGTAFAAGDPWLLKAAIPARFIPSCTFAAAPATWDAAYRLVAQGSTTEPRQFANGDRGGDFLGRPKIEWSTMDVGTTSGKKIMVVGDFSKYKIVDRLGIGVELIPHMMGSSRLPLGVRALYCYWRTGAAVIGQNAFRYLQVT
jgi:HK97 family phage major capsid protein